MLNINNSNELKQMMNYHRTKDMVNLLIYFPSLSPIKNLTIVKSFDDYKENIEFCKKLPYERNDSPITKPVAKSTETTGINGNIEELFAHIKASDPEGVLVLFDLCNEASQRYQRYAGISVGVSVGNMVCIDAVGKGFDGREVSKGISTHESYYIPWCDLRRCNIDNFKEYRTYLISNNEYKKSREERIKFLTSVGFELDVVELEVPKEYKEIPSFIWLDVIKNLIKKLEKMDFELLSAGLDEFAISGHTEGKKYLPWQIFDKSRYISNSKSLKK